jgi:hypothetical protein
MSFTLTFNTAQSSTTLTAYGNTFTATDGTKKYTHKLLLPQLLL